MIIDNFLPTLDDNNDGELFFNRNKKMFLYSIDFDTQTYLSKFGYIEDNEAIRSALKIYAGDIKGNNVTIKEYNKIFKDTKFALYKTLLPVEVCALENSNIHIIKNPGDVKWEKIYTSTLSDLAKKINLNILMVDESQDKKLLKIFGIIKKCANLAYFRLDEKTGFKITGFSKNDFEEFINTLTVNYIEFDIWPFAEKYNVSACDAYNGNPGIILSKVFNDCEKIMKEELKKSGIDVDYVKYTGDWDDGPFSVKILLK